MSAITKAGIALTSIGLTGGGVGLGIHLMQKTTVSTRLINEGFQLATSDDWTKLLEEHNKAVSPNIFENGTVNKDVTWLSNKCKEALSDSNSDSTNYKLARQWCVKERAIKDIFESIGLRGLDNTGSADDAVAWKSKETDLKLNNEDAQKLSTEMSNAENTTIARIKAACKSIGDLNTSNKDFNEKFELAKKWCAIKKQKWANPQY